MDLMSLDRILIGSLECDINIIKRSGCKGWSSPNAGKDISSLPRFTIPSQNFDRLDRSL